MKKLLVLLFASLLVLAACGQEESKLEDKKETKSSSKESKKDDKKSEEDKSDEDTKQVAENENTQEQPTAQENVQSQEPVQSQEQQPVQQEQSPTVEEQQNLDGHTYHYDPEYDTYGYTGQVAEDGMPVLDPNENVDTHGGQVPNDNLTDEEIKEMMGE